MSLELTPHEARWAISRLTEDEEGLYYDVHCHGLQLGGLAPIEHLACMQAAFLTHGLLPRALFDGKYVEQIIITWPAPGDNDTCLRFRFNQKALEEIAHAKHPAALGD